MSIAQAKAVAKAAPWWMLSRMTDDEMNEKTFEATEQVVRGALVITIAGELDIATSPRVRELLSEAARDRDRPLVIDLTRCVFVDSTGLATLLHGAKPAQNGESNVALVSAGGEVRKLLELTAIDRTIPVFESLDSTIEAVLSED
jgi:anti-sigma B factor antagonist